MNLISFLHSMFVLKLDLVLLNNVLSSLLKDTVSNDAKKLLIDRFLYAVM